MDTEKEQEEKPEDIAEEKELEDSLFEKLFEDAEQQDDKKNIYIQYRIINNHGVIAGDDAKIESIQIKDSEKQREGMHQGNILDSEEKLNNWLMENYESYPLALMAAVAVFSSLPYTWVVQAADTLFELFKHKRKDEDEKRYGITELLHQFGAEICQGEMNTYTGKTPIEVVYLTKEEYQEKILKYIWKECPQLHDTIICWLKKYSMQKPMSMLKRAVKIMGALACWDYYYFLNSMVHRIQDEKNVATDMVTAQIIITLSKNEVYQQNVHNLLYIWSKEYRVHYLLTGVFVCVELDNKNDILENIIGRYIDNSIKEIHEKRSKAYIRNLYDFFGAGMRAFTFYRILTEKIYDLAYHASFMQDKRNICELFLRMFAVDINLARFEDGEDAILVKMCMIRHDVSDKICFLWQLVWQCRHYRQIFYDLMAHYDMKINGVEFNFSLEKFVDRALGKICTKESLDDICRKIHRRSGND